MIHGLVNAKREPTIPLLLRGPGGDLLDIDTVIDTGFTGELTLPNRAVPALGSSSPRSRELHFADGTSVRLDTYDVEVDWFGAYRIVAAFVIGTVPLVGTRLGRPPALGRVRPRRRRYPRAAPLTARRNSRQPV